MQEATAGGAKGNCHTGRRSRLREFLDGHRDDDIEQAPIADFFPHCTVLFADIAGFTVSFNRVLGLPSMRIILHTVLTSLLLPF
jgi:hypothetical protein